LPLALTFNNRDVAVNRQICEAFNRGAGSRPFDFEPVNFCSLTDTKHHSGIVRGEIASPTDFHASLLQIARLIRDHSTHSVRVSGLAYEVHAEPVILRANIVSQ